MLPTERYEALMEELEDLRIEAVARERLASIDMSKLISHDEMLARIESGQ
jgi:antitoxin StbD